MHAAFRSNERVLLWARQFKTQKQIQIAIQGTYILVITKALFGANFEVKLVSLENTIFRAIFMLITYLKRKCLPNFVNIFRLNTQIQVKITFRRKNFTQCNNISMYDIGMPFVDFTASRHVIYYTLPGILNRIIKRRINWYVRLAVTIFQFNNRDEHRKMKMSMKFIITHITNTKIILILYLLSIHIDCESWLNLIYLRMSDVFVMQLLTRWDCDCLSSRFFWYKHIIEFRHLFYALTFAIFMRIFLSMIVIITIRSYFIFYYFITIAIQKHPFASFYYKSKQ